MAVGICSAVVHLKEISIPTICKCPPTPLDSKRHCFLQFFVHSECKFSVFNDASLLRILRIYCGNSLRILGDSHKCYCTNAMNSEALEVLSSGISSLKGNNEKLTKNSCKKIVNSLEDKDRVHIVHSKKSMGTADLKDLILASVNMQASKMSKEIILDGSQGSRSDSSGVKRRDCKAFGMSEKSLMMVNIRRRKRTDVTTKADSTKALERLKFRDGEAVESPKKSDLTNSELRNSDKGRGDIRKSTKEVHSDGVASKRKKKNANSPGMQARIGLDMCSKRGDVLGAIALYDYATRNGVSFSQYHYTVLLYLCSSAAMGVIRPAKSGTREMNSAVLRGNECADELQDVDYNQVQETVQSSSMFSSHLDKEDKRNSSKDELNAHVSRAVSADLRDNCLDEKLTLDRDSTDSEIDDDNEMVKEDNDEEERSVITVGDDLKQYAISRGFEIYERMISEEIPVNEATLTSVARMAMAVGNGELAFDVVKQMKSMGITPRLRSYGPAMFCFCNNGDIQKAFEVEDHMLNSGVYPEGPELEALLKVSVEAGRADKVYYLMHKLRKVIRQVPSSIAELIEQWFQGKTASRVGKRKWDAELVRKSMENGGGSWHGLGWLGSGKWSVARTSIGEDGICGHCNEKLATIDIDPIETEAFANSVASIASKREQKSHFQNFQNWLNYYGPFEAVVDAANVGLFSQRRFSIAKVNAVANAMRQKFPSRKWPLIIVHNKRLRGGRADDPPNRRIIDKWKNADALYATPTGSNDDWYWLYAAIKCKCLLVTNDEMRDHIFQMLGTDFFPRWKERHQVHFSFGDAGVELHMPPSCSIVIQESEQGHWHVPIAAEQRDEKERIWLCVTKAKKRKPTQGTTKVGGKSY